MSGTIEHYQYDLVKTYGYSKNFLLIVHDFILYLFIITLGVFLILTKTWYLMIIGFLFVSGVLPLFLSLFIFRNIKLHRDRIELNQYLVGKQVLNLTQIKSISLNSTGFVLFPVFRVKKNWFKKFYFTTSALSYENCYELEKNIKKLMKGYENGSR
jgi:hypothetical protein